MDDLPQNITDRQLVGIAENINPVEWMMIQEALIPKAKAEKTRKMLKDIATRKYHQEEYDTGVL